ncbi:MAG TPA: hypothetical protein VL147_01645 [Devosia sp.]|nr:hypothetical protein [Devosia sp.]
MTRHRPLSIIEYVWRFGARSMLWAYRLMVIGALVYIANIVLDADPSSWAMVAVIAIYGSWEITRTIRAMSPNVTILTGRTLEVQAGASIVMAAGELGKAVTRIVAQERSRVLQDE